MESQDVEAQRAFQSDNSHDRKEDVFNEISPQGIRLGFIRKTYLIIAAMLLFTVAFSYMAIITGFGTWQLNNLWALIVTAVIGIAICIVLCCYREAAVRVPTNYLLLLGFTICEAYLVSWSVAYYMSQGAGVIVIWAALLTLAMTLALTLFAFQTKWDITGWGGYLFVGMIGVIILMIMGLIININWVTALISALCIIFFGIYLVYDTQLLAGNKRQSFSEDDYIVAALNIYIDIIFIFLELMALLFALK